MQLGGIVLHRDTSVVARSNAIAVIVDFDTVYSMIFKLDLYYRGVGIQGVLNKL
jgi:hypothetical protein